MNRLSVDDAGKVVVGCIIVLVCVIAWCVMQGGV